MTRVSTFRFRTWAILTLLAVTFVTTMLSGTLSAAGHRAGSNHLEPATAALARVSVGQPHVAVLVVGDSLVYQARKELRAQSSESVAVRVASELGTAPCDWAGSRFDNLLVKDRPDVVVLAFSGNAGAASGCVSTKHAYPLTELLANYRDNLGQLADHASAAGAKVVLATPPARNPAAPPPPAWPTIGEMAKPDAFYGFQGVAEVRELYADIASASGGSVQVSDAAALAVAPHFVFTRTLPCISSDGTCPASGRVDVRRGRDDAIHFDADGHGATRFAKAMIADVVATAGL